MDKKYINISIKDLFEIKKVYGQPIKSYETGTIPYVTGSQDNNGIVGYVQAPKEAISKGNCISVDPIKGFACYQPIDFVGRGFSGASINLLYNDNLNELNAIYLCTVIEKVASGVAAYTNLFNSNRLANATIKVPIVDGTTDQIDFNYMAEKIKELEAEKIKELEAYLLATGLDDYELTEEDKEILASAIGGGRKLTRLELYRIIFEMGKGI